MRTPTSARSVGLMAAAALSACAPEARDGVLTGIVTVDDADDADPVAAARVRTFDASAARLDDVSTDQDGRFEAAIPWAGGFFVQIEHAAAVPTCFSVVSTSGAVEGGVGDLWLRTAEQVESLRATFSTCPTAGEAGAIVEGQVKVYLPVSQVDDLPAITTARVTLTDPDGVEHTACYLDGRSQSDPDATVTGGTGRFAFFGLPAGVGLLHVEYFIDESYVTDTGDTEGALIPGGDLPIWMVEGGVSPLYPFWAAAPQ